MAWTTSASLRARPIGWDLAATQLKAVRFILASMRRSLWRWHPGFALALPLAALGLLTPLLPLALTAGLLVASGGVLALHAARKQASRSIRKAAASSTLIAGGAPQASVASLVPAPQIGPEWQAQRLAGLAPATWRLRLAAEQKKQKDKDWADLMARVNHDLRTPLNAVIGFSELMALELFGPLGDDRYQDYVHHIRDSATDLLKSAEDTLTLTALIAGSHQSREATACDLELLAADAWAFVSRRAVGRAISFDPRIPANLEVVGEPRTMRQILVNMLSEAVARAGHGERVILAAATEGELVELALSVSKERAKTSHKGNSLAICLARTLLEMQGTSLLEIDSPNHGWRAVTVLDRAVQADFFIDCGNGQHHDAVAALAS